MPSTKTGVLIMAYGTAPSMKDEDIFNYLRHILQYYRRIDPSKAEFNDLKERLLAPTTFASHGLFLWNRRIRSR